MKAVLINAAERTVTDVDFDGDWREISKLIDCRLFTVVGGLPDGDDLFVDDEGLLTADEQTTYFKLPWYPTPLCGSGLILGCDTSTGDSTACNHNADFYREQVDFMGARAVWLWKELHDSSWPEMKVFNEKGEEVL